MAILRELLDRAVIDDEDRPGDLGAKECQASATGGGLLGPTEQSRVRVLEIAHEEVTAVVEQELRLVGEDLGQVPVTFDGIARRATDDRDAMFL